MASRPCHALSPCNPDNVLLETDSGGTAQVAYTLEPAGYGNLLAQRRSGATAFHHFDALGSTDRLTDASEAELAYYVNSAFGVPKAATGNHPNRLRFVGRLGYRSEADTGQYDVRRRRYDPERGQWIGRDPIMLPRTNRYSYTAGNPVVAVDPSGLVGQYSVGLAREPDWLGVDGALYPEFYQWGAWSDQRTGRDYVELAALWVSYELLWWGGQWRAARALYDWITPSPGSYKNVGIDYPRLLADNPQESSLFCAEFRAALQYAWSLPTGGAYTIVGTPERTYNTLSNTDWRYAIQDHWVWGSAELRKPLDDMLVIQFSLHLWDAYAFPPYDMYEGRLHMVGLARDYMMRGLAKTHYIYDRSSVIWLGGAVNCECADR